MTVTTLRSRYLNDLVATASPAKLLIMLYDRLVLDLGQAEKALRESDRGTATSRLMHAQEIVMELRVTLDMNAWDGAQGLASLYSFLLTELVGANIRGDADRVASCRALVEPLRDAWREAAASLAADARAAAAA